MIDIETKQNLNVYKKSANSTFARLLERQSRILTERIHGKRMKRILAKRYELLKTEGPKSGFTNNPAFSVQGIISIAFNKSVWDRQSREDIFPILEDIAYEIISAVASENDKNNIEKSFDSLAEKCLKHISDLNQDIYEDIEACIAAGILAEEAPFEIIQRVDKKICQDRREKTLHKFDLLINDFVGQILSSKTLHS